MARQKKKRTHRQRRETSTITLPAVDEIVEGKTLGLTDSALAQAVLPRLSVLVLFQVRAVSREWRALGDEGLAQRVVALRGAAGVRALTELGVYEVNPQAGDGRTALCPFAVGYGRSMMLLMMEVDKDLQDYMTEKGGCMPPLLLATFGSVVDAGWRYGVSPSTRVRALGALGADMNATTRCKDMPFSALHLAACYSDVEVVQALLESGADPNQHRDDGDTPLCAAAERGRLDVVRTLLEAGADVDQASIDGKTALYRAAQDGKVDVVLKLVEAGANLNKPSVHGFTPLYTTACSGEVETVRVLLEAGADINQANARGCTPLHAAAEDGKLEVVRVLLEAGADLNKATTDGHTPLSSAAYFGKVDVVRALLEAGADINHFIFHGETSLIVAAQEDRIEVVRALVKAGANLNQGNLDGKTALHMAVCRQRVEVIRALAEAGANVNLPLFNGNSPLMTAVECRWVKLARVLVEYGANPVQENWRGDTPLSIATQRGYRELVEIFCGAGAPEGADTEAEGPLKTDVACSCRRLFQLDCVSIWKLVLGTKNSGFLFGFVLGVLFIWTLFLGIWKLL